MNTLLKYEKNGNLNQHGISRLSSNPAECKSLLNIMPLDSRGKPENDKEVGRSMVEMLGVLAVMGVLSVAGIAGYNNAMNRHRANELLNEANKRATVVAMQATQGRTTFSINEFTNPAGYKFNIKNWNNRQFSLVLTQSNNQLINQDICSHMKNMVGEHSAIRQIGKNCQHLVFNKDLSTSDLPFGVSCTDDAECDGCQACQNGYCMEKCDQNQVCVQGSSSAEYVCENRPSGCEACSENQLCQMSVTENFANSCEAPDKATCKSMSTRISLPDPIEITTATGKILPVYFFSYPGTFWTQKALCEFHGKRMISLNDLGIKKDISQKLCAENCLNIDEQIIPSSFWENLASALLITGDYFIIRINDSASSCESYVICPIPVEGAYIRTYKRGRPYYSVLCVD